MKNPADHDHPTVKTIQEREEERKIKIAKEIIKAVNTGEITPYNLDKLSDGSSN